MVAKEQIRHKRGRPRLPEGERKDRSAKRSFYMPERNYELFFRFCNGDITREIPVMAALWMAISGDLRDAVRDAVREQPDLQAAVNSLKTPLPDLLVDEALGAYISALPRDKKVELLSGRTVSLPAANPRKKS